MKTTIYQNVYDVRLMKNVSADAEPLVRQTNPFGLYEYGAFQEVRDRKLSAETDYIGLFSLKFAQKMMISVAEAKAFVASNPGYDVYSFNPYPYESYVFFNQWESSEFHHPGIRELVQNVFDHFGFGSVADSSRMRVSDNNFCNFWIGSRAFFDDYTAFMSEIGEFMLRDKQRFLKNSWHKDKTDTPYFPMIIEFLFGFYVKKAKSIKHLQYANSKELYGLLIPNDSPIRFEKKRTHFFLVKNRIEELDAQYLDVQFDPDYRKKFDEINFSASTLLEDGIEKLYVPKTILR